MGVYDANISDANYTKKSVGSQVLGQLGQLGLGTLGGLASGGLSLIGNYITNKQNAVMNDKLLAFQKYQYEDLKKYNSMSQQVKRMRDAGVNPALALGAGQLGTPVSSVGSPSATPMESPSFDSVMQGFQMQQQQPLIDANTEKTKAEAQNQQINNTTQLSKNIAEIGAILAKSDVDKETRELLKQQQEQMRIQLQYLNQNEANKAHILQVQSDFSESNANWDNEYKRLSVALLGSEKESKDLLNAAQRITNKFLPSQYSAQIASLMAGVVLSNAQAALANTTNGYVSEQKKHEIANTIGQEITNVLNSSNIPRAELDKILNKANLDALKGKGGKALQGTSVIYNSILYLVDRVFGKLPLPLK